jgi:two-component system KDP operon response regulator KdpE
VSEPTERRTRRNRVLVIDDDMQLLRALRIALSARGYDVAIAHSGAAGLAAAEQSPVDLVIVDLGLPDIDGVSVVEALRGWTAAPIIVLSARLTDETKIHALDAGADDYVTKPFSMGELLARIRAALRRTVPTEQTPVVTTEAFTIDLASHRATVTAGGGREARLTPTEWHLLEVLVRHPDRLVTHQQLLHEVWGPRYDNETNYLRVHIANLRRKLEPDPAQPRYLRTDPGLGYRFTPDP